MATIMTNGISDMIDSADMCDMSDDDSNCRSMCDDDDSRSMSDEESPIETCQNILDMFIVNDHYNDINIWETMSHWNTYLKNQDPLRFEQICNYIVMLCLDD